MKTVYLNLNILDIRCGGTDNTKERCCYISIVAPLETKKLGKKKQKQHESYRRDFSSIPYCE